MRCKQPHCNLSRRLLPIGRQLESLLRIQLDLSCLISFYAHLVELLLVVCSRLGAIIRDKDQLLAWKDISTCNIFEHTGSTANLSSAASGSFLVSEGTYGRRTTVRLSFIYNQRLQLNVLIYEIFLPSQSKRKDYTASVTNLWKTSQERMPYIEFIQKRINSSFIAGQILWCTHGRAK